ncbi:MAG TPA: glycosyltransferase family 2 protein [Candidatus Coprenecus pullicola]|nr:glycosyltransferase family 2 protein [Candidatus Coprenecus pullicola]
MEIIDRNNGYALLRIGPERGMYGSEAAGRRLLEEAVRTGAAMAYSGYWLVTPDGGRKDVPVNDCQLGSVREDFDFGALVAVNESLMRQWEAEVKCSPVRPAGGSGHDMTAESGNPAMPSALSLRYGQWYSLRLFLSRHGELLHLPELLYGVDEVDTRASGQKQFDYVDPRNREAQIEMEAIFTDHLRKIGAWLPPRTRTVADDGDAVTEKTVASSTGCSDSVSVIIPVLNRAATIGDALRSALSQRTDFPFNVLVVDNRSTDGTSERIEAVASEDSRVVHIIPGPDSALGIGGCWNLGINHPLCGRYAVQLDSDDMYSGPDTLQRIVDVFRRERCAMVIGSYAMTDFDLRPIPPGIIDHREWTDSNGHNNALRINGLGAPRAFHVQTLRSVGGFENVSYGEDYGVALRLTREYRLCRIYEPLYNCRRWSGNSDAALDITRLNAHNAYKDSLRTREILARRQLCRLGE